LRNVTRNAVIIEEVLVEVDRIRAAQGLVSNEAALREEETAIVNLHNRG
jgi:hypothetical protein